MPEPVKIEIEDHHPHVTLELTGSLRQLDVYKLKSLGETFHTEGKKFVTVDLTGLSLIDSAGIGVLLQLQRGCNKEGGHMNLVVPATSHVRRVLEISSVGEVIPCLGSLKEALADMTEGFGIRIETGSAEKTHRDRRSRQSHPHACKENTRYRRTAGTTGKTVKPGGSRTRA